MVFVGTHRHRVDAKGRMALPAGHRASFADRPLCYVVPNQDERNLMLFAPEEFAGFLERLQDAKRAGAMSQRELTRITAHSHESSLDAQGRINIPDRLLEFAGIEKDVVIEGAHNHLVVSAAAAEDGEDDLDAVPSVSQWV